MSILIFIKWNLGEKTQSFVIVKSTRVIYYLFFTAILRLSVVWFRRSIFSRPSFSLLFLYVDLRMRVTRVDETNEIWKMKSEEIYGSVSLHKLSKITMNTESTVPQQADIVVPRANDQNDSWIRWVGAATGSMLSVTAREEHRIVVR